MPTLAVQLASGQEVVSDFFLGADSTIGDVADAAGCQLAVASSRCVLLSPSGDCMAHSLTCSASNLTDGDVITVLVMDLPRVYAHRMGASFAAVTHDGSVVTWGRAAGNARAFAAVKEDGSVVMWSSDEDLGGDSDSVKSELKDGVLQVVGNARCFCRREGRRFRRHVGR